MCSSTALHKNYILMFCGLREKERTKFRKKKRKKKKEKKGKKGKKRKKEKTHYGQKWVGWDKRVSLDI